MARRMLIDASHREETRVVVVDAGRVVLDGAAADVLANDRLVELGVGPPAAIRLRRAADGKDFPSLAIERLDAALAEGGR